MHSPIQTNVILNANDNARFRNPMIYAGYTAMVVQGWTTG
jgi:hypothetical protein